MQYIVWLSVSAGLPLIFIWLRYSHLLRKYKQTFLYILLFALVVHIPWDLYAIVNNIWLFPYGKNVGLSIFNIPLEEYLYMIFVPLLGASIALVAKNKFSKNRE